jgi:hypothetical protein
LIKSDASRTGDQDGCKAKIRKIFKKAIGPVERLK